MSERVSDLAQKNGNSTKHTDEGDAIKSALQIWKARL